MFEFFDPALDLRVTAGSLPHWFQPGVTYFMPNHVHLLACLLGATDVEEQCYSWKKDSAARINRALGRRGRFWHEESFDHLVRSPEQFDHFRHYIADNPQAADLSSGASLHWQRPCISSQ